MPRSSEILNFYILLSLCLSIGIGFLHSQGSDSPHPVQMALFGYLLTVLIETPVLFFALSSQHKWIDRVASGFCLTALSYPFVAWVFPCYVKDPTYLLLAREVFAAVSECLFFWIVFYKLRRAPQASLTRDLAAIIVANLLSYFAGEVLKATGAMWKLLEWFGLA